MRFEAGLNIDIRLGLAGKKYTTLGAIADAVTSYEELLAEKRRSEVNTKLTGSYSRNFRRDRGRKDKGNKSAGKSGSFSGSKRTSGSTGFNSQGSSKLTRSDGNSSTRTGCYNCGQLGHITKNYPVH